jgi:acyl-coenzyme A synthetase/AMP-(fatty) acid ligase
LSKQKRPRQIEIVAELPKNFLGKIQRRRLREGSHADPVLPANRDAPPERG